MHSISKYDLFPPRYWVELNHPTVSNSDSFSPLPLSHWGNMIQFVLCFLGNRINQWLNAAATVLTPLPLQAAVFLPLHAANSAKPPLSSEDPLLCSGAFRDISMHHSGSVQCFLQKRTASKPDDTALLSEDFSTPARLWRRCTSLLSLSLRQIP